MQTYRCANCMSETTAYPCSNCGYNGSNDHLMDYALMPGSILNGKYLIGRVLGQGGFGITYIGFDLALERKVAIKEFFPAGFVSRLGISGSELRWNATEQTDSLRQNGLQSVLSEARKMAKLESIPQVVSVREAFETNNTAYIVMDYVEGESLKNRLLRTGPLSWPEAERLFLPVIEALEKVHQAGLIHRDISPDNLMVLPDGTMKLLDLGAAKDISGSQNGPSAEVVKNGFSPFEQYTQRGSAGPWSDVYAMAATIVYSLTGKLPPSALDRVADDTLNLDMPELQGVPQSVRDALKHAMEIQMKDRTQSMTAFGNGLRQKKVMHKPKIRWIPVAASAAAALIFALVIFLPRQRQEPIAPPSAAFTPPAASVSATKPEPPKVRARIEEQEIYNRDGIQVTVTSLKYTGSSAEFRFTVKNNTKSEITISTTSDGSVNGYACDLGGYVKVDANSEEISSFHVYDWDSEEFGIDVITDITFRLEIKDSSYKRIALSDPITICTDQYGTYTQVYDDSGEQILKDLGVTVLYKKVLTTEKETGFQLYCINNSTDPIRIRIHNLSLNGFMASSYASTALAPGARGFLDAKFSYADLKDSGISVLGDIELKLQFEDLDYKSLGQSERLTIHTGVSGDSMPYRGSKNDVLFDQNGIFVANLGYVASNTVSKEHSIALYFENNTDKELTLRAENVNVNGIRISSGCSNGVIEPGKKAIVKVSPYTFDLEKNNITSVSSIQAELGIYGDSSKPLFLIPTFTVAVP